MNRKMQLIHTLALVGVIVFAIFVIRAPFYTYGLFLTGIVLMVYVFIKAALNHEFFKHRLFDSLIFTIVILNVVESTGGLVSPLFFLNYLLMFAVSLLLEPTASLATALTLIIVYILKLPPGQTLKDLLPVFSLALFSPFGYFLAKEYMCSNQKSKVLPRRQAGKSQN